MSDRALFPEKEPHPSRHLTSLKGCSPQTGAINSAISRGLISAWRRGVAPRGVRPAASLKSVSTESRGQKKIDFDSDSFSYLPFTHLFCPCEASVHTFYTLIDYKLLFSLCCVQYFHPLPAVACFPPPLPVQLLPDAMINVVVMTPAAASELAGTGQCVESSGRCRLTIWSTAR